LWECCDCMIIHFAPQQLQSSFPAAHKTSATTATTL
jgi:hypothetical protein